MQTDDPSDDLSTEAIAAILLAAGESRRMGRPKLSLPFGAGTILESSIQNLLSAGICRVILVHGNGGHLPEVLASHPEWKDRLTPVLNLEPDRGMLHSVQLGAAALRPNEDFAVALADQPAIPAAIIESLCKTFRQRRPMVLAPVFAGKRGHPVIFSYALRAELMELRGSATLRDLVHAHPVLNVPVSSDAIHRDIDDPASYQAEVARLREESGMPGP